MNTFKPNSTQLQTAICAHNNEFQGFIKDREYSLHKQSLTSQNAIIPLGWLLILFNDFNV
jgi:hypothetical protein